MMDEKKNKADDHDACVRAVAEELRRDNWTVKADLEGHDKPSEISKGYVPDIQAEKKGCLTRICEVATPEMFEGNKKRYVDFKNYCSEYDFHFYVVEKDGTRKQIDPETFGKK
ncbi:MAG TPA: hypothetical protein VLU95_06570 [Candidatus Acidoferrum sp.]|nr:hypothetical protein [Candidatus Acidoferrum sp.]